MPDHISTVTMTAEDVNRVIAHNKRLRKALTDLVDRVERNGGLGEYNGGRAFALSQARAALKESGKEG